MPLLKNSLLPPDWIEPDDVPRPVVMYAIAAGMEFCFELTPHDHSKSQLLLVQRGALSCEVENGMWIVPPRSAIWIPGGTVHAIKVTGELEAYGAFVVPKVGSPLPASCCSIAVTPLLRELVVRAAHLPLLYEEGGANSRLIEVLLDELASAKLDALYLPMPADRRLRRMVDSIMASPSERGTIDVWAQRTGVSGRTLERMMSRETGMSFGRWRKQFAIMLAVERLAGGASMQQVAADLGYESVPSFATMFRKVLGTSPGRYMTERYPKAP
jgi:AraC-like DNA-binding protein